MTKIGNYKGYDIYLSDKPDKKYFALVPSVKSDKFIKVYFGGDPKKYQHYYDKMGYYSNLNHNDEKRRANYHKRHGTENALKGTANYFAANILW